MGQGGPGSGCWLLGCAGARVAGRRRPRSRRGRWVQAAGRVRPRAACAPAPPWSSRPYSGHGLVTAGPRADAEGSLAPSTEIHDPGGCIVADTGLRGQQTRRRQAHGPLDEGSWQTRALPLLGAREAGAAGKATAVTLEGSRPGPGRPARARGARGWGGAVGGSGWVAGLPCCHCRFSRLATTTTLFYSFGYRKQISALTPGLSSH